MGLLAIAAVPLVTMAGIAAWQTYQSGVGQGQQLVLLARESAVGRHEAAVQTVRQMLGAVAQSDIVSEPTQCAAYLDRLLALDGAWYTGLRVVGPGGQLVCASGRTDGVPTTEVNPVDQSLARDAAAAGDLVVSRAFALHEGVTAAFPIVRDGAASGAVLAGWRKDQFIGSVPPANGAVIWLVDTDGRPIVSDRAPEQALPSTAIVDTLLAGSRRDARAVSRGGKDFVYACGLLSDGWRVLVGLDETANLAAARALLLARFIETAVLLLVGLVAVGIGVNAAVVEPIKLFTHAVSRWQGGGAFTPGNLAGVPSEVAELSTAFAQATGKLADREAQLRTALGHQDLLMHEIHHRVRNNLQIVASLLNLQGSRIRQPEAQAEFQTARDRVRALATLHRHLYVHGELQSINAGRFLTELCGQLFEALGEAEGQRIRLDIEAPELRMASDQAVPLALIVTETVSNAVKHAFPGGRQGAVAVRLTTDKDHILLVIEDDGVGLEAGRAQATAHGPPGIGVQLIRGFARQLGARMIVEEGQERGTRYMLEIPRRQESPAGRRVPEAPALSI